MSNITPIEITNEHIAILNALNDLKAENYGTTPDEIVQSVMAQCATVLEDGKVQAFTSAFKPNNIVGRTTYVAALPDSNPNVMPSSYTLDANRDNAMLRQFPYFYPAKFDLTNASASMTDIAKASGNVDAFDKMLQWFFQHEKWNPYYLLAQNKDDAELKEKIKQAEKIFNKLMREILEYSRESIEVFLEADQKNVGWLLIALGAMPIHHFIFTFNYLYVHNSKSMVSIAEYANSLYAQILSSEQEKEDFQEKGYQFSSDDALIVYAISYFFERLRMINGRFYWFSLYSEKNYSELAEIVQSLDNKINH